ncbi:unnamed protein product [Rhizophagus irregularis]|nr:unnamed protein product [Rhizophagus irregularis]
MRLKTKRIHRIGIKKPFGTAFQNQNIWTLEWTLVTVIIKALMFHFLSVLEDTSKSDDQILDDYDYGPFKIMIIMIMIIQRQKVVLLKSMMVFEELK